jgi:anti-sigma factor RsiW
MNHSPALRSDDVCDELSWSAFRFIAGEMAVEELVSFEARLADDQAAREAVAEAVELFHAVCAAEAAEPAVTLAAKQTSTWSQRFTWVASGAAAAAIVVAAGLNAGSLARWLDHSQSPAVAAVTPALADAWTATRSEYAAGEEATHEIGVSRSTTAADELSDEELANLAEEQLTLATETPSWMTAAVLGLSSPSTDPLDAGESLPQEN